jgi:uncharacterized protein YkwD
MTRIAFTVFIYVLLTTLAAGAASCGLGQIDNEALALINQARAAGHRCGDQYYKPAGPLRWNADLTEASARHANDMAKNNYFEHRGLDGRTFVDRISEAGYRFSLAGENISAGRSTVEEAIGSWLKSPPHCANIMRPEFVDVGVACAFNSSSRWQSRWAMELGQPK